MAYGKQGLFSRQSRYCRLCETKIVHVDYKNVELLSDYLRERGKIAPSRVSGACPWHQHRLTSAIKRARTLALVPFVTD